MGISVQRSQLTEYHAGCGHWWCGQSASAVFWAHKSPESATKAHLCCLLFLYYNYMNIYGMSDNNSMVCEMFILIQCPQPYRKLSWDMYCTRIVTYIKNISSISKYWI